MVAAFDDNRKNIQRKIDNGRWIPKQPKVEGEFPVSVRETA